MFLVFDPLTLNFWLRSCVWSWYLNYRVLYRILWETYTLCYRQATLFAHSNYNAQLFLCTISFRCKASSSTIIFIFLCFLITMKVMFVFSYRSYVKALYLVIWFAVCHLFKFVTLISMLAFVFWFVTFRNFKILRHALFVCNYFFVL